MTRAVALLHGFTGSPASFETLRAALAARGVAVETPALLGHGVDDAGVTSFDAEVDRLARRLRACADRTHLVGYSLGGRVAVGLLCRHPELFSGATLVSAQPGLGSETARADRRTADDVWCNLLAVQGVAAFVDAWEELPLFATQVRLPDAVRMAQRKERLAHTAEGLIRSLRTCGLGAMPSYAGDLSTVRLPTTFLVGALDRKFVTIARQMRKLVPASRVELVPETGHNVVLENPGAVLDVVSRALEAT